MLFELFALVLIDAILFAVVRMISALWEPKKQGLPLTHAVLLLCFGVVAHWAATRTAGRAAETAADGWIIFLVSAGFGAFPIAAFVHLVMTRPEVEAFVHDHGDLAKARRFRTDGDLTAALVEYRKAFEAKPNDPWPLFAAAAMLAEEERHDEAAQQFRDLMQDFDGQPNVWAKAAYRLADLLENTLSDTDGARALLAEIAEHAPNTEFAKEARERIDNEGDGA